VVVGWDGNVVVPTGKIRELFLEVDWVYCGVRPIESPGFIINVLCWIEDEEVEWFIGGIRHFEFAFIWTMFVDTPMLFSGIVTL